MNATNTNKNRKDVEKIAKGNSMDDAKKKERGEKKRRKRKKEKRQRRMKSN